MLRILVIKPSSLGDIVHGLQVVQALRDQLGDVRVTWVAREVFAPLVRTCSAVDEVLVFERKGGVNGFIKLIREIRNTHYDWVLDMQGLARSGLMTLLSRADNKAGRSDAREFSAFAYNKVTKMPTSGSAHAVAILEEFLPLFGLSARASRGLQFKFAQPAIISPDVLQQKPVLVFPESRRPEKNWDGYSELIVKLVNDVERPIICMGQRHLELNISGKNNFYNLSGKSSIGDMIACIASSSLVICNDSGPMHVAASMGKTVLALFGPTLPELYGPYPLDCPEHHVLRAIDGDFKKLEVAEVLQKAKSVLGKYINSHK